MIEMVKPKRETKEDFYYNFPKSRFYIVRMLSGKWTHNYPRKDGILPESFSSKSAAEKYVKAWDSTAVLRKGVYTSQYHTEKVVSGVQASKYPVPKRH